MNNTQRREVPTIIEEVKENLNKWKYTFLFRNWNATYFEDINSLQTVHRLNVIQDRILTRFHCE